MLEYIVTKGPGQCVPMHRLIYAFSYHLYDKAPISLSIALITPSCAKGMDTYSGGVILSTFLLSPFRKKMFTLTGKNLLPFIFCGLL